MTFTLKNIAEIEKLKAEYLLTLSSTNKEESYLSDREFAEGGLDNFIEWLEKRLTEPVVLMEFRVEASTKLGVQIPGAFISITKSPVPFQEVAMVTDKFGCFTLNLPSGQYAFKVHADGMEGELTVFVGEEYPNVGRVICE